MRRRCRLLPRCNTEDRPALFLLVGNVLGLGIGPLAVALLTDYIFVDQQSVGQSLQVVLTLALPVAAFILWRVRHYFNLEVA